MLYRLLTTALALSTLPAQANVQDDSGSVDERIEITYRQAYRGDIPVDEIPQAISVFDRTEVEEANLTRFRDILLVSPSIALQNDGGNVWDSYSVRGFPGNENVPTGYLVNGFAGGRGFGGHRDVSNIEYVELLKGPGSALYGRSDPGGVINVVTRKPQYAEEGYLKTSVGDDDRYRLEGDYTNGLSDNLAFRINGAWQDYGSFRDFVTSAKQVVNPSLRWQVNKDTSVLYAFEYMQHEQLYDRGIVVLNNDIRTVPRDRYLGEPDDGPTRISSRGHQLTFEHFLSGNWVATGGVSYVNSNLDGYSSDAELVVSRQNVFEDGRTLSRQRRLRDYDAEDITARFELSGSKEWLGLNHRLLMGTDAYNYKLYTSLSRIRPESGVYELDIFNPQYGATQPPPVPPTLYINDEEQEGYGVYIQDQIELTTQWQLLLGLRFDQFDQYTLEQISGTESLQDDQRTSPRVALSYLPTDDLMIYTSYSEGFVPLSGTDYQGQGFAPEESDSVEIGFKYSGSHFQLNGAVFDATKTNILTADPVNEGFPATLGAATSSGLELEFKTQLSRNLSLNLAYSLLDTATKNDIVNLDWGITIPAGSDLVNVPKHSGYANLGYDLSEFGVNAQAGLRARYVDDRLGDTVDPSYRLPSYQVVDLYYRQQLTPQWQLQFNIDNALDEYYMSNSYAALWTTPGTPRQVSMSLRYDF